MEVAVKIIELWRWPGKCRNYNGILHDLTLCKTFWFAGKIRENPWFRFLGFEVSPRWDFRPFFSDGFRTRRLDQHGGFLGIFRTSGESYWYGHQHIWDIIGVFMKKPYETLWYLRGLMFLKKQMWLQHQTLQANAKTSQKPVERRTWSAILSNPSIHIIFGYSSIFLIHDLSTHTSFTIEHQDFTIVLMLLRNPHKIFHWI